MRYKETHTKLNVAAKRLFSRRRAASVLASFSSVIPTNPARSLVTVRRAPLTIPSKSWRMSRRAVFPGIITTTITGDMALSPPTTRRLLQRRCSNNNEFQWVAEQTLQRRVESVHSLPLPVRPSAGRAAWLQLPPSICSENVILADVISSCVIIFYWPRVSVNASNGETASAIATRVQKAKILVHSRIFTYASDMEHH